MHSFRLFLCLFSLVVSPILATLTPEDQAKLAESGWDSFVGSDIGIWVSVKNQKLMLLRGYTPLLTTACSTASKGTGSRVNSLQTPLGWHRVREKIGDAMPWGAIFESRQFTGRVWSYTEPDSRDLILTRILWLEGCEPGKNQGPGIDSYERYIYIHATPEEDKLGSPASHGCVRISNSAIIRLFTVTPLNTPVLITEW